MSNFYEIVVEDWLFRIQPPEDQNSRRVILAIHGWTGNQYSMDIFTLKLRARQWIIFPCAPYPAEGGGFSWIPNSTADQKDLQLLNVAAQNLHSRINLILHGKLSIEPEQLNLMGFSQGAALALIYSLSYLKEPAKIALMSGFMPMDLSRKPAGLAIHSFLITHGKQDPIIPVDQAYRLVTFVKSCGGQASLCVADTGHKLDQACLNKIQEFLR